MRYVCMDSLHIRQALAKIDWKKSGLSASSVVISLPPAKSAVEQ